MVDFINPEYIRLNVMSKEKALETIGSLLMEGEIIIEAFKAVRDQVIFTSKRIIAVTVQGVSGKRVSYISMPYSRIQTYGIETNGRFDLESELNLWINSVGKIHFEIGGDYDIRNLSMILSEHIL